MKTEQKELVLALVLAGGMIAIALGNTFARRLGYIDSEAVTRMCSGISGLGLAWFGNRMPKLIVLDADVREVRRIGGWALALSGLASTGLWVFAPINIAETGGMGVVLAGVAVTLGRALSLRDKAA